MDNMLGLLGDHRPCFIFRSLFLEWLPEDICSILVHSKVDDCRQLAKAADTLWEARQSSTNVVQQSATPGDSISKKRPSLPTLQGHCFYHAKFGDGARKCQSPCSFPMLGNGQAGHQWGRRWSATDSTASSLPMTSSHSEDSWLTQAQRSVFFLPLMTGATTHSCQWQHHQHLWYIYDQSTALPDNLCMAVHPGSSRETSPRCRLSLQNRTLGRCSTQATHQQWDLPLHSITISQQH